MPTYPEWPVTFVRGEGSWLFDADGRRYLDFLCGLAVTSLGHCHPEVVAELEHQARTLWHVSNLFGNELGPEVAARIDRLLGGGGRVFLCNSGAEANECAIKLARRWSGRGRSAVVSAYGSFHGRTLATLAATGQPDKHEPFCPMPEGFRHVEAGDLGALESALGMGDVAAVLVEAIQGEGGVRPLDPEGLRRMRQLCSEHGVLLILDEVQTGLGRTGRWFAFEHAGVRPDVVTLAKALGNGMPIGACWARGEVAESFRPGDHATTFGGQPLAAAAARATLRVMEDLDVPQLARRAGERLARELAGLPGVVEVRGRGLLLGAALEEPRAGEVVSGALERGLVVNAVQPDTVRLAPSLLVSESEVDLALEVLAGVLG
jgi:acetylornithine/N-succinyldiaminopimelate aminotransferase